MSVAAVIGVRINQVLRRMEEAGATGPRSACPAEALGLNLHLTYRKAFYVLRRRGVIVETAPGMVYMDKEALERMRRMQVGVLCGVFAVLALVMLTALLGPIVW